MPASQVVLATGASSGPGRLSAEALSRAGHMVTAGMRETSGRNASNVAALEERAKSEQLVIKAVELDVQSQKSADAAIADVIARHGHIDFVVHNAGHMPLDPAAAFSPERLAQLYYVNVLGTQRVNRAALPHLRTQRHGLVLWVGSLSTRGEHPPFLAPYFAAKAGMDALAESYAAELIRFGIDTTILVPGTSPRAPTTSPTQVNSLTRVSMRPTSLSMETSAPVSTNALPIWSLLGLMCMPSLRRSRASSDFPSESARSVHTSTRPKTAARSSRPWRPESASSSTVASASPICCLRTLPSSSATHQQHRSRRTLMPFANIKVPANTLTPESKMKLQDAVTDAFVAVYGERARPTTLVVLEEVHDNGWSLGGTILNEEVLGRS